MTPIVAPLPVGDARASVVRGRGSDPSRNGSGRPPRRLRDGTLGFVGATPCTGLLALEEFEGDLARFGIETWTARDVPADDAVVEEFLPAGLTFPPR